MTDTQAKEVFRASYTEPPPDRIDIDAAVRGGRRRRARRRALLIGAAASVAAVASVVTFSVTGWPQALVESSTMGQAGVTPQDHRLKPDPSDPIFDGLPAAVVVEVLNNPAAQANIAMPLNADERNSMWQGMVGNFVMCRQMLDIYTTWQQTGSPATQKFIIARPQHPLASYKDLQTLYTFYGSHMRAGHLETLREDLLNESGCGAWVPARAGDPTGPTIAEVVSSGH